MKVLTSRYHFLVNELIQTASLWHFKGSVHHVLCTHLKLYKVPTNTTPPRKRVTRKKMQELVDLALRCYHDVFFFLNLLEGSK